MSTPEYELYVRSHSTHRPVRNGASHPEEPLSLTRFVAALIGHVAWPLLAIYAYVQGWSMRDVVRPLGTWYHIAPLTWVLAMLQVACIVAISTLPSFDVTNLQNALPAHQIFPIAECVVALSLWVCVGWMSAVALSHSPRSAVKSRGKGTIADDPFDHTDERNPPAHIAPPYDVELMNEVPVLHDGDTLFFYPAESFFTGGRKSDLNRNAALSGASPATASPESKSGRPGLNLTVVTPLAHRPSTIVEAFKFGIGDRLARMGGSRNNSEETQVTIRNRRWGINGPEYMIDGQDGRWHDGIEAVFDVAETFERSEFDVAINSEQLLTLMSRRGELRRVQISQGCYAFDEVAVWMPVYQRILIFISSVSAASAPVLLRRFTGGHAQGTGTPQEWIALVSSIALIFLSVQTILSIYRAVWASLWNYLDALHAFTHVTLSTTATRWHPALSFLEPLNTQSWYCMEHHLETVFQVGYTGRLLAVMMALPFAVGWGVFGAVYLARIPPASPAVLLLVRYPGWLLVVTTVAGVVSLLGGLLWIDAGRANARVRAFIPALLHKKAGVDEEIDAMSSRVTAHPEKLRSLLDAQAVLLDVVSVLRTRAPPVHLTGVALRKSFGGVFVLAGLLATAVAVALIARAIQDRAIFRG